MKTILILMIVVVLSAPQHICGRKGWVRTERHDCGGQTIAPYPTSFPDPPPYNP